MTTIDSSVESLGTAFSAAVSTADWSLLPGVLHPDVTWTFPGENVISGTSRGIEEIIEKAKLIASYGVSIVENVPRFETLVETELYPCACAPTTSLKRVKLKKPLRS